MNRRKFLKFGSISTIAILPGIGNITAEGKVKQDDKDFWEQVLKRVEEFQIKKRGVSFADHPAIKKPQEVIFSRDLFHLYASRAWGYTPSELSQKSLADRIDIYAWSIADFQIERVEIWDASRKSRGRCRNGQ